MRTIDASRISRREILAAGGAAGVLLAACKHEREDDEGVMPAEDLMREHGVLRRVMYVFDESAHRLETGVDLPLDQLAAGAGIIRRVIEDYHEKLEEQHLFPRFEKANELTGLVATLRQQHEVGRRITTRVLALAQAPGGGDHAELARALRAFAHMYRAHAAREDTVLFPALHEIVGVSAYRELGEQFEDIERDKLGTGGFEHAVVDVARLERAFGLDDLAALTPRGF